MSFKGTEHYREKASRLSPVTVSNGEQNVGLDTFEYKADLEDLCDYVEKRAEENAQLRERVGELEGALADALGVAYWMSGSNDFSPGGIAYEGWGRMNVKLTAARDAL